MSIKVKNISYKISRKSILNDITFNISPSELLTILGPNGSGKSTLINLIVGDIQTNSGEIIYGNKELNNISIKQRAKIRSVMSNAEEIPYDYKVQEIIEMGWIEEMKRDPNEFISYLNSVSYECEIKKLLNRNFNSLSSGEKLRVNLARTLIQIYNNNIGDVYCFLDEPTANLDLFYSNYFMKLIKRKSIEGIGVIMVLHDMNLAYQYSDKILLMNEGKLIAYGKPDYVMTEKNLQETYNMPISVDDGYIIVQYK